MSYAGILFHCNKHPNHRNLEVIPFNTKAESGPKIFKRDRDERSTFSLPTINKECKTIRKRQKFFFDTIIRHECYDLISYSHEAAQWRYNCDMKSVQNLRDRKDKKDKACI